MNITPKKLREIIAKTYWQAHSDGRLCGKNGVPDFGMAALTIEANAIGAGCRPTRPDNAQQEIVSQNKHRTVK